MAHREAAKIDLASIERKTSYSKQWLDAMIERVTLMCEDVSRKRRHVESECQYCYRPYGAGRVGGASTTKKQCGLCDTILTCCNACVDVLCLDCAKANQLCKHCGGDVDMRKRRRDGQPVACKKGGE